MRLVALMVLTLVVGVANPRQETAFDDTQDANIAARWLTAHARPLQHLTAGHGFDDLRYLKKVLNDVRIVGLGEATHGTREFFQVKHRLLEFLVSEMQFDGFVIEASAAACEPINDYVLHGTGNLAAVVSGQGYVAWDTEEFTELVRWLRTYNERAHMVRKVQFLGMDFWRNDTGREYLLDYVKRHIPERTQEAQELFEQIATVERKWPMELTDDDGKALPALAERLNSLVEQLSGAGGAKDLNAAVAVRRYGRLMNQFLTANAGHANDFRSRLMAENVIAFVKEIPQRKLIVWAHNTHITGRQRSSPEGLKGDLVTFGEHLRQRYGSAYYAFGFEFSEGAYQTRVLQEGERPGELRVVSVPPAPDGALARLLTKAVGGAFVVNLRDAPPGGPVARWLGTPHTIHDGWWPYFDPAQIFMQVPLRPYFDGLVFVARTTATHPTANAAADAQARRRF